MRAVAYHSSVVSPVVRGASNLREFRRKAA
jgi:hypothetical protein